VSPYIPKERRRELDGLIDELGGELEFNGDLNYVLFALCRRWVKPSYNNYKNFLGELTEAAEEIRRRILAEYEDEKIRGCGDVW